MSSADISDADHYFVEAALLWRIPQREESQTESDVWGEMAVTKIDGHPKQLSPVLSWGQ